MTVEGTSSLRMLQGTSKSEFNDTVDDYDPADRGRDTSQSVRAFT